MRGLGERQYKERLMTKYKIVSLLDVSPFTFEQLWRISRIQRNVLRKNLNSLVEEETILVHNYSIPYNQEFYGYMYKYPVPYMPPAYGHKYYLLDLSRIVSDAYMNFYYNNKARENRVPLIQFLTEERKKRKQKLCASEDKARSLELKSELQIDEMGRTELRDYLQSAEEHLIYHERFKRETEILCVKFGDRFLNEGEEEEVTEKEMRNITMISEFFTKRDYSLLDVLIRCSMEHTRIHTTDYWRDDLTLPLMRYRSLWKITEKIGLLKNLIRVK
jgi:hypothetical protein